MNIKEMAYNIKSKIIYFFAHIRFYWLGFMLFGDPGPKIKGPDMRSILDVLQPGDVLLRRFSNTLGSILTPGYFSHAAFYYGDNKVIHMLGEGIVEQDILTFMCCDDVVVLRPPSEKILLAREKSQFYLKENIEYDYHFDKVSKKRFYCTEFVDNIFDYPVKSIIKHNDILPDDFLDTADFFKVVWRK